MIRALLIMLLVLHTAASLWSASLVGPLAILAPFRHLSSLHSLSEIIVSLSLVLLLISLQWHNLGRTSRRMPLLIISTLLFGTFAPLVYMLWNRDLFKRG